ncbi:hypothetical protein ACFVWY_08890 [Streptomyces sp. NPDC058195]|uniref:hypothetical protein n=1 Tax=Streptomyces sp. NPDC058195 TaxID=3346375 RepID=UPI0036E8C359
MAQRLTFTLAGRDELSRVLNGTADSADRLRLRLSGVTADADGQLRDLRGRFLAADEAARRLRDSSSATRDSLANLRDESHRLGESLRASLISLAPAAIPAVAGLASSATVLAGQLGAVTVAAGAYALALGPQIGAIAAAAEAQTAYQDAVEESGAASQEAAAAQVAYQRKLASLPPATRQAAVAFGLLRDGYQEWSDSVSDDVMAPVTKSLAIANALLPRTTGLAKGAGSQFDRLVTLLGGAISTPGFDALNARFTEFTERTMRHGVDSLTVFLARAQAGELDNSRLNSWMDYARQQGPAVWDTLEQIGDALLNVLEAGADVGVGMLDVVNALASVASAVPPDAIATLLQVAIAIKAVRLAAVGTGAARAALLALGTQVVALRAAAAGAPGVLSGMTAAIGGLSRGAKLAMAGTGLGLLLVGLDAISSKSQTSAPDVDKLNISLATLARTGAVSGEALQAWGRDLSGLADAMQLAIDPEGWDQVQQSLTSLIGMDSTPVKNAKSDVQALDQSLADMVSRGQADLAAAALDRIVASLEKQGLSSAEIRGQMDKYATALKGQALEQQLAAESMGLFGQQSQEVQAKLDAQKRSADGLRESIKALNDVHRSGLSGMIGFEAAIDAATKAAQENAGALSMSGGQLDLGTEKARTAASALSDLAAKTDEAAASARDSGASWSEVSGIYERGRQQLIANAQQMGLTRAQARALADQILQTPDKTAFLRGDIDDLKAKLADARDRLASAPSSKTARIKGEIADLKRKIAEAEGRLASFDGKSATAYITVQSRYTNPTPGPYAGKYVFRAGGGQVNGPGTSTSDSIPAMLSNGEYVVRASAVDRYGLPLLDAINAQRLASGGPVGRFASGGFAYQPSTAQIGTSTVSSWYDQDMQRLRDAWAQLNDALRAQAKQSTAATRRAVADARAVVNAADRALGLKSGTRAPSGFSLTGYGKNLDDAVKKSAAWERNLQKIGGKAGADVEETLRGMGESGMALVAALAKASTKQFNSIVANLRKLGPTAAATLADYTRQLTTTTSTSKKFQDDLVKLASSGYGDLATQLAAQGDAEAMAVAAAAVKSGSGAKKANAALKANAGLLSTEELTAAAQLMGALSGKKNATVEDVVAAGVSWPMLAHLAPMYAKQIKALPGSGAFVAGMKERGIALASGGLVQGPGTSTSDSVPVWGSTGEYMVKAAAVARYGVAFMDNLNAGKLPVGRAARPGLPAAQGAAAAPAADRPPVTYNIYPRSSVIDVQDLRLIQRQEEARERIGRPR